MKLRLKMKLRWSGGEARWSCGEVAVKHEMNSRWSSWIVIMRLSVLYNLVPNFQSIFYLKKKNLKTFKYLNKIYWNKKKCCLWWKLISSQMYIVIREGICYGIVKEGNNSSINPSQTFNRIGHNIIHHKFPHWFNFYLSLKNPSPIPSQTLREISPSLNCNFLVVLIVDFLVTLAVVSTELGSSPFIFSVFPLHYYNFKEFSNILFFGFFVKHFFFALGTEIYFC
jgi:hypothetical protein